MLLVARPLLGVTLFFSIATTLRAQGDVAIPPDSANPIVAKDLLIREDQELPFDLVAPPDTTYLAVKRSSHAPTVVIDTCDSCSKTQALRRTFLEIKNLEKAATQRRILNDVYIKPDKDKEYEQIRELWKEFFGGRDLWAPYYKAKEIEDWVKKKVSFRVFKMKCKPKFDKKGFIYTCGSRF